MIFNLLARAFAQKAPEYLRFAPLPPHDPVLCAHKNCQRPHDAHSSLYACPHPDGSGYMLDQYFKRERPAKPLTDCDLSILEAQLGILEEMDEATGELADDLEEMGEP